MKILLISALVLSGLGAPAFADDSRAQKNWGTQTGSGGGPTTKIYELNVIAGQTSAAEKGLLGTTINNTYYNQACGICTNIDINGSGNNVSTDGQNTGNVGAQQGVGDGGIKQTIQQ